ncbi:MAG: hypothetical protein L0Y72_31780 [Gemmataceae bacterium]|nr:hypothetical protein [Gemmataceae bacterium]MCI0743634.1 hypothetical protein [Gemmataceae bacterium]
MAQEDSGLVKRGLLLLGLMIALVVVVLTVMLRRNPSKTPVESPPVEAFVISLVRGDVAFPAGVHWANVFQAADHMPSPTGWDIRYTAASALARRGGDNVPWDVLAEMLDENRQMRNFRVQLKNGKLVADETAARTAVISGLRAIADWHRKNADKKKTPELAEVYAAVDRLAASSVMEVRSQAENVRKLYLR